MPIGVTSGQNYNQPYFCGTKKEGRALKENSPKTKENENINYSKIVLGGYIGYKGIISGLSRMLGVRIEEHTTNALSAKKIIQSNCVLDPKFGGTGCAKGIKSFVKKSDEFVHITGVHKDFANTYKFANMVGDAPKNEILQAINRKQQRLTYKISSIPEECKSIPSKIKAFLTSKTFYIGGSDEYFNKNFVPDVDDLALKTKDKIKVSKTKIGAIISALKKQGLSGIKNNPKRAIIGAGIAIACFTMAYKLIKNEIQKKNN